jgi:hypothetical protein
MAYSAEASTTQLKLSSPTLLFSASGAGLQKSMVGDSVADGELDCIEIIAEEVVDAQHDLFHFSESFCGGLEVCLIAEVVRVTRFIGHDTDVFAADTVAAVVFAEDDLFLQHHDELTGLCVLLVELFGVVELVDVLPAATGEGLHVGGESDIAENALPVQWIGEIGEGLVAGVGRKFAAGEEYGFGDGDAVAGSQAVVEKFLVSAPPEGVIDNGGPGESGIFQIGPIERNVL